MILDRKKLLAAIDIIKPAIATKDLLEALAHIWFNGTTLMAYNDASLGLEVPFKTDIKGGLKADLLIGVLSNSNAETIETTTDDGDDVEIKVGRAKLKLALLPQDRQLWTFPKPNKITSPLSNQMISGLKDVMISIGMGTTSPEQLGVTLKTEKTLIHLYTTDDQTISQKAVDRPAKWEDVRVIFPTPFVEQLIKHGDEGTQIAISSDSVVATTTKGVKIFARLIDAPMPFDFAKTIAEHVRSTDVVDIPGRLRLALERATVIAEAQTDKAKAIECLIKEGKLRLYGESPYGVLRDSMELGKDIPSNEFGINPKLLKRGLPLATKIKFGDRCVVLEGDRFMYICAHSALPKN
jgi:DNA polymerase III sliding clamp (beta) subunit (PCNA family)